MICQNCKKEFEITGDDLNFYKKMDVPSPTWCPECRLIRRMAIRNERSLYKRKCDLCNADKIMMYSQDNEFKVYCHDCFYSDDWDAIEYGQEYDFSKPFFEQYIELFNKVPRMGIIKQGFSNNSEYNNRVTDLKNCYMIFGSAANENCFYGVSYWDSKDSIDCYNAKKCERCYQCIDIYNSNNLKYSQESNSCADSSFLLNCRNCTDCFGCVNLRNKRYCIFNEQYSKEEYFKKLEEFNTLSRKSINKIKDMFKEFSDKQIVPSIIENHSNNVSGNWIENSKNVKDSFNCDNIEDGRYLFTVSEAKDVMDYTYWGKSSELIYEASSVGIQSSSVKFSAECWDQLIRGDYCFNCFSSSDLFGCVGLKNKQYCILNKQYAKEEYEELLPKIKQHMMNMPYIDKNGRVYKYGEFFPTDMFPFAYNESIAQEFFPKTKEEALNQGYSWTEPEDRNYSITLNDVPDN
ncbi:MAG: hypothetical protein U9R00_03470, partial [Patescibacteria group bacterium]|nr:hypothetical protein [Patescibacteria group bacterium]